MSLKVPFGVRFPESTLANFVKERRAALLPVFGRLLAKHVPKNLAKAGGDEDVAIALVINAANAGELHDIRHPTYECWWFEGHVYAGPGDGLGTWAVVLEGKPHELRASGVGVEVYDVVDPDSGDEAVWAAYHERKDVWERVMEKGVHFCVGPFSFREDHDWPALHAAIKEAL